MPDNKIEEIEKFYEKVRELEKEWSSWNDAHCHSDGFSDSMRRSFPEAFKPKKHWAIEKMDELIGIWRAGSSGSRYCADEMEKIRSAFNDDGTLKGE